MCQIRRIKISAFSKYIWIFQEDIFVMLYYIYIKMFALWILAPAQLLMHVMYSDL